MNCSEKASMVLKETPFGKAVEAYRNPRLCDDGRDYLTAEHRTELIAQSEIVSWEQNAEPVVVPGVGTIESALITTRQGYQYDGIYGEPWVQETDSLGLATRPLGTSKGGYNRHLLLNYLRDGNHVGFLNLRGSIRSEESRKTLTRISLANTAAILLCFGNEVQRLQTNKGLDVHPRNRFTYGASHAGAVAVVANALDGDFEQNIRATDAIAPSPAIRLESPRQWLRLGEQIAREPVKIPAIIARLGIHLAMHYRESVELNFQNLSHQLELCGAIFNGELDAAALHVPISKLIRITEYEGDHTCNDGGLELRLSPETHPHVTFDEHKGVHMTIIDRKRTLPIMKGFNKAYREQERGSNDIDSSLLFARARELAPGQYPRVTEGKAPDGYKLAS